MATTPIKFPPPPYLVGTDQNTQMLNRWLLEIQNVLSAAGGIDPNSIAGYTALQAQVATNTTDIATLETTTSGQGAAITTLQGDVTTINGEITTINGELTTLGARNQVRNGTGAPAAGLGIDGDWYGDTAGGAGARVWIKKLGAWVAFPF